MGVHDANYKKIKKELGIPEDEPIFVLRAKDDLALHAVARYRNDAASIEDDSLRPGDDWIAQMDDVINEFAAFRAAHPDLVRVPD